MEDPAQPSLARQAESGVPLRFPWTAQVLKPGTSFDSLYLSSSHPFLGNSPFDCGALGHSTFVYTDDSGGRASYVSTSSTTVGSSRDHFSAGLGVTVGCSFLNASVSGQYDKDVMNNNDALKSSVKSSYRAGTILFNQLPSLSLTALADLKFMGGHATFRQKYGDYYVAGFVLGADTAVMLSESSDVSATTEQIKIVLKVHALFFTVNKTLADIKKATINAEVAYSISGFDTLSNTHQNFSSKAGSDLRVIKAAATKLARCGEDLSDRVTRMMEELGLKEGRELTWIECEKICTSGLVVEVILVPFSTLREWADWGFSKDII